MENPAVVRDTNKAPTNDTWRRMSLSISMSDGVGRQSEGSTPYHTGVCHYKKLLNTI